MSTFGSRLKEIRKSKNMTQEDLAAKMNCSKMLISYYENGKRNPKIDTIEQFAHALECSFSELAGFDERIQQQIEYKEREEAMLLSNFHALNDLGKEKVLDYSLDIRQNPKYNKRTNPFDDTTMYGKDGFINSNNPEQ